MIRKTGRHLYHSCRPALIDHMRWGPVSRILEIMLPLFFERSSIARQRCIEANGTTCVVCGFNFEEKYGYIGKGFIHVHHIIPLNEIGSSYKVNYKKDLIPVCPNCHAMLHRKNDGAFTWEELKQMIDMNKQKEG